MINFNIIAFSGTKSYANKVVKDLKHLNVECELTIMTENYLDEVEVKVYSFKDKTSNNDLKELLDNGFKEIKNRFDVELIIRTYKFSKKTKRELMPVLYD